MMLMSCSVTKNTWGTRAYHQTKVKYNIFFNGNRAFDEGQMAIRDAAKDDYTDILYLYPISDHNAAQAAASKMDVTIEKCRKCIKLHSIKKKPKPNPKRMNDPKYRAWLKQEEFNNQMGRVWIRLGEAEFHKGDFLGSVGTFNYVQKHYDYDPDIVAQCQLWTARAYAEMDWLYEAEDVLRRVQVDNLKRKHASLYSSASADVLIKAGRYREAIPFVRLALPYEKRKLYRPRFQYVLAQLLERDGKRKEAAEAYGKVLKLTPPLEMEFNARIRKAELEGMSALRSLQKMAKLDKNKDQLDRIYGAMGNICLHAGDTAAALENYRLAIEGSTQNGPDKAAVLLRAGDLYFDRNDYQEAQPCYAEAVTILSSESDDYQRVYRRSEALDQLIRATGTVQLQDSLQLLSTKSEEEQLRVVEQIIAALIEKEKADSVAAAQAAREAETDMGLNSVDTRRLFGGSGQSADWYFYNSTLIKQGKQDFRKRWGNRPLEDEWRRLSKSVSALPTDDLDADLSQMGDSLSNDSLSGGPTPLVTDIHSPQYYLQQIPRTPEDMHLSDSLIADAMFEQIFIYRDQLQDTVQADRVFEAFQQRFVSDPRLPDLYYMYYLSALRREDNAEAEVWRSRLMAQFPDTKQARIVSDPMYFTRLRRMAGEQDSLYEATYEAYKRGQFPVVKTNTAYAEENYPLSPLMPRFLFLNSIAVARTQGQDAFVTSLQDMVERYPESELSAMAKEMLAMMGQGMASQKGKGNTNLADMRTEEAPIEEAQDQEQVQFDADTHGAAYVLLCLRDADEQQLNDLLYEVALFNFSQFLIKDFELQSLPTFDGGSAVRIGGLDGLSEAEWYAGLVRQAELQSVLEQMQAEVILITEENYKKIGKGLHLDDYKSFLKK